jgi:hypothetical protein
MRTRECVAAKEFARASAWPGLYCDHVGDRELPYGSARRARCALRERQVRPYPDRLQLLPYGQIP